VEWISITIFFDFLKGHYIDEVWFELSHSVTRQLLLNIDFIFFFSLWEALNGFSLSPSPVFWALSFLVSLYNLALFTMCVSQEILIFHCHCLFILL
jgi:hypothetical protein